jgi:hypothetical protein
VLVLLDHPLLARFAGDEVLEEVASGAFAVRGGLGDGAVHLRREVGEGVDLAVRVRQGDADLLAAVLEHVDLAYVGPGQQLGGAVGPGLEHQGCPRLGELGEGRVVFGREADDLAAPAVRAAERGEAVLEDGHLVVRRRDLGEPVAVGRAQRALVGRRLVRAVLPLRGDGDPLALGLVVPGLRRAVHGLERTPVHVVAAGLPVAGVEIEQFPAVRQGSHGLLHCSSLHTSYLNVVKRKRTRGSIDG